MKEERQARVHRGREKRFSTVSLWTLGLKNKLTWDKGVLGTGANLLRRVKFETGRLYEGRSDGKLKKSRDV